MGKLKTELMAYEYEDQGAPQYPELSAYFIGFLDDEAISFCEVCGDEIRDDKHKVCASFVVLTQ